jgi:hypothetical protein
MQMVIQNHGRERGDRTLWVQIPHPKCFDLEVTESLQNNGIHPQNYIIYYGILNK